MTVSTNALRSQHDGNDVTVTFPVGFSFEDQDDLRVIHTDSSGTNTVWVRATQYTVSGTDIVVSTSPTDYTPATGERLTILSADTYDITDNYVNDGSFSADTTNNVLDKLTILTKQNLEKINRTAILDEATTTSGPLTMPDPADNAGKALRINSAGTDLEAVTPSEVGVISDDTIITEMIIDGEVTLAKIQKITTDRLLGRDTDATGDVEQLTVGGGVEFTGSGGIQSSAYTGDVTKAAGGTATTIAALAVTNGKIGPDAVDGTKIADLAVDTEHLAADAVETAKIADNNVTLAKMATQADATVLANVSGGVAVPSAQTLTAVLDDMMGSTQGNILYRNATVWTPLAPGTAEDVLTTKGAAANPVWQTPAAAVVGSVVKTVYAEYTANTTLTTVTPFDDTIPQNTEGTQILTATITPASASNDVRIVFQGTVSSGTNGAGVVAALFVGSTAGAIASDFQIIPGVGFMNKFVIQFTHSPATTSAVTYKIRVGPQSPFTCAMNGQVGTRFGGGNQRATLVCEEIKG